MKKPMFVFALAVAVLGGAVIISAISSPYRWHSHWRAVFTASTL